MGSKVSFHNCFDESLRFRARDRIFVPIEQPVLLNIFEKSQPHIFLDPYEGFFLVLHLNILVLILVFSNNLILKQVLLLKILFILNKPSFKCLPNRNNMIPVIRRVLENVTFCLLVSFLLLDKQFPEHFVEFLNLTPLHRFRGGVERPGSFSNQIRPAVTQKYGVNPLPYIGLDVQRAELLVLGYFLAEINFLFLHLILVLFPDLGLENLGRALAGLQKMYGKIKYLSFQVLIKNQLVLLVEWY